jgi:hypothetical protein
MERRNWLDVSVLGMLLFGSQHITKTKAQTQTFCTVDCGILPAPAKVLGSFVACADLGVSPQTPGPLSCGPTLYKTSRQWHAHKRSKLVGKDIPRSYAVSASSTGVQLGALPLVRPLVFCCCCCCLRRGMDMNMDMHIL